MRAKLRLHLVAVNGREVHVIGFTDLEFAKQGRIGNGDRKLARWRVFGEGVIFIQALRIFIAIGLGHRIENQRFAPLVVLDVVQLHFSAHCRHKNSFDVVKVSGVTIT